MKRNYMISIPIMNGKCTDETRADYAAELHRAGAGRVFLALPRYFGDTPARREELALLRVNIPYFTAQGFDVGVWFSAVGHGGALEHEDSLNAGSFTRITGFQGAVCDDSFCISDPDFIAATADYVRALAEAGAKMIQLDDDFRLGHRSNGMGCTCDRHLAMFASRCGKHWQREDLYDALWSGGPSDLRTAWLDLMGESMENFARVLRDTVDAVDPAIRLGFCAAPDSWDADGTDVVRLTRIFAGRTKPFLRLIGAAYWAANGRAHTIGDIINYERLELSWVREKAPDIEVYSEGDVYPRPRYRCPAWLVESMDAALRTDGRFDGMLKYMLDYSQHPLYETGYIDRHVRDLPLLETFEDAFAGTVSRGIYVHHAEHTLRSARFGENTPAAPNRISDVYIPAGARFLDCLSVPVSTEKGDEPVLVVGESVRDMPREYLHDGVILDASAARILAESGTDVGFVSAVPASRPSHERFPAMGALHAETIRPEAQGEYFRFTLKPGAEVLSTFSAGEDTFPAVWFYENGDGQRFLVYAFDFFSTDLRAPLAYSYCRQEQFRRAVGRLKDGYSLPAFCGKEPDLFLIVRDRQETGERIVGVFNSTQDELLSTVITLDREYREVSFFPGCMGHIEGRNVVIDGVVPAHAFTGFTVR